MISKIRQDKKLYEPIAIYHMTWEVAIYILNVDYYVNDAIVWKYSNDNKIHHSQTYFSSKGEYFKVNGTRYYVHDFYKCI